MALRIAYRTKHRLLCFDEVDAQKFGEALQARFPGIRFRMFDYGSLQKPRKGEGPPRREVPVYEVLGDPSEWNFWVWVEPEGWEPIWVGPNPNGYFLVANEPNLKFVYDSSLRMPIPDGNNLRPGRIWARFRADDREHERFLNAVWRISAKLSTNVLDIYDRHTGRRTYRANRTMIWAGHHALEWCRADTARRIDGVARPVGG